jgi:hypothetical protein
LSYPLSSAVEDKKIDSNLDYHLNSVSLKADRLPQNMFVAAEEIVKAGEPKKYDYVDKSGQVAQYLPGGANYSKDEFGHRLWLHKGSLFSNKLILYPSEYSVPIQSTKYYEANKDTQIANTGELISIIESATRIKYHVDSRENTFWPNMTTKQSRLCKHPVHWTLEKFSPVWQGCDFHLIVRKGEKSLDFGVDSTADQPLECDNPTYHTMMYKRPRPQNSSQSDIEWDGIRNTAFYLDKKAFKENEITTKWEPAARQTYHFGHRPYLMIEVGPDHPFHNYIIELAYGRKPRFLHISEYKDSVKRLNGNGEPLAAEDYSMYQSCRVLSTFEYADSGALLSQEELTISVKNHLGRLVVWFSGHEKQPWVIEKKRLEEDDSNESERTTYDPHFTMVVPSSRIRIHGGNMSVMLNFGFTKYKPSASLRFPGQSVDTHQFNYEDLYVTMSTLGTADPKRRTTGVRNIFAPSAETKDRLGHLDLSYRCDAHTVYECIMNRPNTKVELYKHFRERFLSYGKGIDANNIVKIPDGKGHVLKIYNGLTDFDILLTANPIPFASSPDGPDGDGQYVSTWTVGITFGSGQVVMNSGFTDAGDFTFADVLTPILTDWRLHMTGDHKPTENLAVLDISPLVTNITDHWAADIESNTFEHDMTMTCYLPRGLAMGYNPDDDPERSCRKDRELYQLSNELYKLHDRAFYVTVKYWWGHPGVGYQRDPDFENEISGVDRGPSCDDTLIQMTGICYGGTFEISNNVTYMSLRVCDYTDVLKKQFIFNSPFFDGCSAHVAIYELAKMAGFDDCTSRDRRYRQYFKKKNVDRRPLGYIQHVIDAHASGNIPDDDNYVWNGETSKSPFFGLPISYATLSDPAVRFPNGESYLDCMKFIAKQDGSILYFDRYGVLKYESTAGLELAYASDETIREWYRPKIDFYTSPLVNIPASQSDGGGGYDPERHEFVPGKAAHLVYNTVKYSRDVESVFNQIVMATAVPEHRTEEGDLVAGYYYIGHCFYDQLFDPNSTGFLGFRKALFIQNGVYGGVQETKEALEKYAAWSIPTSRIEFETFGIPCLKPHDVISVDGNMFYITEISHEIIPEENKWWMSVTGEWMRPYRGDLGLYNPEDEI